MAEPVVGKLTMGTVHVTDYERAVEFYGKTLGFDVLNRADDLKFAIFDAGGAALGVHEPPEGDPGREAGGVSGLIFEVANIDEAYSEARRRGIRIGDEPEKKPWGVIQFTIYDPDDNEFIVWQPTD